MNFLFLAAADFGKSLVQLEELEAQLMGGLECNKLLLKGLQKSFVSDMETIQNNMASIDERIKKLNGK